MSITDTRTLARLWTDGLDGMEDRRVAIEVECEGYDHEVALHTFIDGKGSKASLYFSRDQAREMAERFLRAARG
jgi:hypothetical protein